MSKPINFLKLSWIVFSVTSIGFLIFYGVSGYQNRIVEDEPRWMICKPNRDYWGVTRKSIYIKFHNTKKVIYNPYQQRWVEDMGSMDVIKSKKKEAIPTIEMHEDKTHFTNPMFGYKKKFPMYVSDKYYIFYNRKNEGSFWLSTVEETGQHIILNRDDLTLLEYNTDHWLKGLRKKKYNDEVVAELFREINEFPKDMSFNIRDENTTEIIGHRTAKRKLFTFQCKEQLPY